MKKLLLLLPLVALAGCSSTNITKLAVALAKDESTTMLTVTSVYGTVKYIRVGRATNESKTVSSDGTVTIKTNP